MVSADAQQLIMEAQGLQQQLQVVEAQKEAFNLQVIETGKALEELDKPGMDDVYKIVGPILVQVKREAAKRDLKSRNELAILRMKTLGKSESALKEKLEDLKKKLI